MNQKEGDRVRENTYYLAALLLGGALLTALLVYLLFLQNRVSVPPCMIYELTGLYCPACGGTRAVLALLRGDVLGSLYYHPVVVYFCGVYFFYVGGQTAGRLLRKSPPAFFRFRKWFVRVGLGLLLLHTIARNILLLCFGIPI